LFYVVLLPLITFLEFFLNLKKLASVNSD